jgi:hypothetical protein
MKTVGKFNILFVVFIAVFAGCKHNVQVVFPDTVQNEMLQYIQEHEYTVVIYLDSADCSPCLLNAWKPYKRILEKKNTGIFLVFHNLEEQTVVNTLKSINVTFHFILDEDGAFKVTNEIYKFVKDNIFVMDKNRNVIMAESPIANDKTWNMFTKRIKKKIDLKKEKNE